MQKTWENIHQSRIKERGVMMSRRQDTQGGKRGGGKEMMRKYERRICQTMREEMHAWSVLRQSQHTGDCKE